MKPQPASVALGVLFRGSLFVPDARTGPQNEAESGDPTFTRLHGFLLLDEWEQAEICQILAGFRVLSCESSEATTHGKGHTMNHLRDPPVLISLEGKVTGSRLST